MFDDAEQQLQKILALVKLCPENLQEKCFEVLLNAYVAGSVAPTKTRGEGRSDESKSPVNLQGATNSVPEAIKTRFNALIGRTKSPLDKAVELFDFNVDPFNYHALVVPGASNREKMRSLALLLALKGYLTSASWTADWKEFRAACIDHSCWDQNNVVTIMKHEWFKNASLATDINLSPAGIKAADGLFGKLSGGSADSPT